LEIKRKDYENLNLPFDGELYVWDYKYYSRLCAEKDYELDNTIVKEHFPVSFVVPAVLDIYQNLLGVRFEEVKAELWHPETQQFAVWDKSATDDNGFLGWCYLDLYPRGE
jgi:Zn-dependent oligopeptidase